jgi:hypothetical protein
MGEHKAEPRDRRAPTLRLPVVAIKLPCREPVCSPQRRVITYCILPMTLSVSFVKGGNRIIGKAQGAQPQEKSRRVLKCKTLRYLLRC